MIQFYHLKKGLYQGPYLWERDCMTSLGWRAVVYYLSSKLFLVITNLNLSSTNENILILGSRLKEIVEALNANKVE